MSSYLGKHPEYSMNLLKECNMYIAIDKSYIEDKIAELKDLYEKEHDKSLENIYYGRFKELEDILSQGIEIPVEKKWSDIMADDSWASDVLKKDYPNGVIIKPK